MNTLVKLSENGTKILILLLLVVTLVFVIVGYISLLVGKIMKKQGEEMGTMMHDMVVTYVINDKKHYRKVGFIKNRQKFFKDARIAALILLGTGLVTLLVWLIYRGCGLNFNLFDFGANKVGLTETNTKGGTGFNTLFYIHDYAHVSAVEPKVTSIKIGGTAIEFTWAPLVNKPHLSAAAIPSYIIVPALLVGLVWWLLAVQAYIARVIAMEKLIKINLKKDLSNFNQSEASLNNIQIPPQQNQVNNSVQPTNNPNQLPPNQ